MRICVCVCVCVHHPWLSQLLSPSSLFSALSLAALGTPRCLLPGPPSLDNLITAQGGFPQTFCLGILRSHVPEQLEQWMRGLIPSLPLKCVANHSGPDPEPLYPPPTPLLLSRSGEEGSFPVPAHTSQVPDPGEETGPFFPDFSKTLGSP